VGGRGLYLPRLRQDGAWDNHIAHLRTAAPASRNRLGQLFSSLSALAPFLRKPSDLGWCSRALVVSEDDGAWDKAMDRDGAWVVEARRERAGIVDAHYRRRL
jgi:hypothetical protein